MISHIIFVGVGEMSKFFKSAKETISLIIADDLPVYSAQASYYIIISVFPFMMLFLSLVGFIFPLEREGVRIAIQSIVPETFWEMLGVLIDELFEKSVHIVSLTALTALWTSSRGFAAVERGVRRIYATPQSKNFLYTVLPSLIYTVTFMIILILTLGLQVFGNTIISFFKKTTGISLSDIVFIKSVLMFAILCIIFQLMYYFFGRRLTPFSKHLPGAVFSAAGWLAFAKLFSIYVNNYAHYSYIYGSITMIVLLMLWLFCCVMIILLGAELNRLIFRLWFRDLAQKGIDNK